MKWFSVNLRYLRRNAGMRQNDLADRLGYKSFTTIQKWESGAAKPGIDTVEKLARLFQVRIDDLLSADLSRGHEDENSTAFAMHAAESAGAAADLPEAAESILDYQTRPADGLSSPGSGPESVQSPESFD